MIDTETIIAPIPLHWRRLMARRFNQSAILAERIAAICGGRLERRLFTRKKSTPPQREAPSTEARRRNVAGAFAVPPEKREIIRGAKIVLIDDVLTTGATLSSAARTLKAAGAVRVNALVLARVVKGGVGAI